MEKIIINEIYDLTPSDSHKNFYGKAKILIAENGDRYLQSYDTIIMGKVNGKYVRYWDDYSVTTGRHVVAFAGIYKKEWNKMEVKETPILIVKMGA